MKLHGLPSPPSANAGADDADASENGDDNSDGVEGDEEDETVRRPRRHRRPQLDSEEKPGPATAPAPMEVEEIEFITQTHNSTFGYFELISRFLAFLGVFGLIVSEFVMYLPNI